MASGVDVPLFIAVASARSLDRSSPVKASPLASAQRGKWLVLIGELDMMGPIMPPDLSCGQFLGTEAG